MPVHRLAEDNGCEAAEIVSAMMVTGGFCERQCFGSTEGCGMKLIIETKRRMLREFSPGDLDALYAVLADSDIM